MLYKKVDTAPFCHNALVWQTDGQTGLRNTVRCITCSRTLKSVKCIAWPNAEHKLAGNATY